MSLVADLEALSPDEWAEMTTQQWRRNVQRHPRYSDPEPLEELAVSDKMRQVKQLGDMMRAMAMLGFMVAARERDVREGREPDFTEQDITDATNQAIGIAETLS